MPGPETTPPPPSDTDTDSDATPRAKRQILLVTLSPPPPRAERPRTNNAPLYYYDHEFEEQERRWRESRPLLRHTPPARDEENGTNERDDTRRHSQERGWSQSEDINLDDWTERIGIWLLTCMIIMALSGAAAVLWILVTQ